VDDHRRDCHQRRYSFLVQRAIEIQGWGIWVIVLAAVGLFVGFILLRDKLFQPPGCTAGPGRTALSANAGTAWV
jgi:hypothetical protein